MTQRLKVPPTKSTLLELERRIVFLQQGHDMLERKKELLTRLVYDQMTQYRTLRREIRPILARAYHSLGLTHMQTGTRMLRRISVGLPPALDIQLLPRSNLGVEYPAVRAAPRSLQPVGLMWTDADFDQTRIELMDFTVKLVKLAEAEAALWRLLAEQRRTQKRVNALKYNIIPRHRETIRYIESALAEEERNTLFQIKILREKSSS